LIFGNPSIGTPLMQADPRVGVELPLRMLIWQDPNGTHVGYLDPQELADRYALDGHQQTLERQSAVLTKLAAAAAGWALGRRTPSSPTSNAQGWSDLFAHVCVRMVRCARCVDLVWPVVQPEGRE
jgi:hypothetical protein